MILQGGIHLLWIDKKIGFFKRHDRVRKEHCDNMLNRRAVGKRDRRKRRQTRVEVNICTPQVK